MKQKFHRAFIVAGVLLLAGFGCSKSTTNPSEKPVDIDAIQRMSPKDAARAIRFKQGSSFEIRQSALKVQNEWVREDPELSRRVVTLNEYMPEAGAVVQWTLQQKVRTDEYKKALEEFQKGATTTEPRVAHGMLVTAGSLKAVIFKDTHKILFPALWPEGEGSAQSTGAVWVSRAVYEEMSRTRASTVYLNFFDGLATLASGNEELAKAIEQLRAHANASSERTDLDLMKAEGELSDTALQVNGKEVTVQTIKARSWFGEMTVLNNPENPLILKFSMNPPVTGDSGEASAGMGLLKDLLSFEVTRIDL
ncbi:MAG TPA: hypothetical protein VN397_05235 [Candidatus Methylomirabilis sp.]|nr:hypothetical protein [Candidatus Methylomirabilis sp.]